MEKLNDLCIKNKLILEFKPKKRKKTQNDTKNKPTKKIKTPTSLIISRIKTKKRKTRNKDK